MNGAAETILSYEGSEGSMKARLDTPKGIVMVGADALKSNGTLNQDYFNDNKPLQLGEGQEAIAQSAEEFNQTVQYYRGHFEKRMTLEYLAGLEKMQKKVTIEISGENFEVEPIVLAGQGVRVTWRKKQQAMRDQGCIGIGTFVGSSILEDLEGKKGDKVNRDFIGVAEKNLQNEDARLAVEIAKEQKSDGTGVPTAINAMAAAEGDRKYAQEAIDADVDLIFCGAGDPTAVAEVFAAKVDAGQDVKTGFCPIFNDARSMTLFMKRSLLKRGIVPPIIQFEDPEKAGGHEGGDERLFGTGEYSHTKEFFEGIREALEDMADKVEAGKIKVPAGKQEDIIRQLRNVKIMVTGGVNTHERACELLGSGADLIGFGTSADNAIAEESDADSNFARVLENGFDGDEINEDPLKIRQLTYYKSTAGYPAQTVDSPFVRQMEVLNQAMKVVWDDFGEEIHKAVMAEIHEIKVQQKENGTVGPIYGDLDVIKNTVVSGDAMNLVNMLFERGQAIPGWHFDKPYFVKLAQGITHKCVARCLKECGPTGPMFKVDKKNGGKIQPSATRECILGPLAKAFQANGETTWKRGTIKNLHLGLFFSGSEAPSLRNTTTENFVRYMKTGIVPSGALINPIESQTDKRFGELWDQSKDETIEILKAA